MSDIEWLDEPEDHNYPAARAYLQLVASPIDVVGLEHAFAKAKVTSYKAKDVIRASGLALLPRSNEHVVRNLEKIATRRAMSPVLLVRGSLRHGYPLQIADGYHRTCAVYYLSEDAEVHCKLVALD